jgi:hypothetical protein
MEGIFIYAFRLHNEAGGKLVASWWIVLDDKL